MSSNRSIGAHLRLQDTYTNLARQAIELGLTSFQLFFMPQTKKNYVRVTHQDAQNFAALRNQFQAIYVHSSYWINLATGKKESAEISERLLRKELALAEQLNISHLVLHPGSAKGHQKTPHDPQGKIAGIEALAAILNNITKENNSVKILLENTAHEGGSIGSDFQDFIQLKKLLTDPKKIGFCLDFAHAFAYGYNLEETNQFVDLVEQSMGIESLDLIHLNDSIESQGSHKDHHEIPGKGLIGKEVLQKLLSHKKFASIPIICELPPLSNEEIKTIIQDIKTW